MQIILKQIPDSDTMCLFDTRSNSFVKGCSVKNIEDSSLVDLANNIVSKSPRAILNIVQNWEYDDDNGYCVPMFASKYLDLNPDIRLLAKQNSNDKPIRRTRKKIEKPIEIDSATGLEIVKPVGKSGRPRRIFTEHEIEAKNNPVKRPRGRPRKNVEAKAKPIVYVDGKPRGRGRPRKINLENTIN